jgi:hypothetical protein
LKSEKRPEIREIIYGHPWFHIYIMVPEKESGFRLFTTGKSMEGPRTFGFEKFEIFTNSCRS